MKYIKLFEDFKENEPAVIHDQLKEIDKVYQYLFKNDKDLKNRFEIDTTNITNQEGINYWYNINLFELDNEQTVKYYWKIFINITLKDLIEEPENAAPNPEETNSNEESPLSSENPIEDEVSKDKATEDEEEIYEATEDTSNKDENSDKKHNIKPKIETCYIKLTKYDYNTHTKLGEWEDNIKTKHIFSVKWLLHRFKDVDKHILKNPRSQSDVERTKKHLKNFTDIHYQ